MNSHVSDGLWSRLCVNQLSAASVVRAAALEGFVAGQIEYAVALKRGFWAERLTWFSSVRSGLCAPSLVGDMQGTDVLGGGQTEFSMGLFSP